MKIKQLKLKNFAHFEDFEIVFNDDITHLVGINGSGKTTVGLNAIWAGFKGIAEKGKDVLIGERYRFISPGKKSLDIEITLHDDVTDYDVILKRHITKDVNQISIESSNKESAFGKEYVENLLNVAFLSASHFTSLSGKEQALALGIDTAKFDLSLTNIKNDAQFIRKQIKDIGELQILKEVKKVSISDLIEKRDEIMAFNSFQSAIATAYSQKKNYINSVKFEMQALENVLKEQESELLEMVDFEELKDTDELDEQIKNAEEINELAAIYESHLVKINNKIKLETELIENQKQQDNEKGKRLEYIKTSSFGMKGLSVDDTGSLLLDDKPIKSPYFSKGELEMSVANIASGLNPDLKVRFIDDFEMLDEENQRKIIKGLTKRGFQIITASVGDKKTGDKSVLLRQCKIVD